MQPAYYENLEEIQNKYWSMLDDAVTNRGCLLYTSPSPRDPKTTRMPSSA